MPDKKIQNIDPYYHLVWGVFHANHPDENNKRLSKGYAIPCFK